MSQYIYPPRDRVVFDGGKNNKFEKSIIQDNESSDCANVVFTSGSVETRQGISKLNSTSVGSYVCDGLFTRRDNASVETMIAWFNGTAHAISVSAPATIGSGQSVFTAGIRVGSTQYENHIFFGNGSNSITGGYKYNGTDFTRHGVYPPTNVVSMLSNAIGVVNGDVQYKFSYVNSQSAESDVSSATATFAAALATVRITSISVAPQSFGVASRRIYRSDAGAAYKRVAEIADNTTTAYNDNTATAGLGTTAPTDNGIPPNYSFIIYHQNRLFMNDTSNRNRVYWTEVGEPYTVKSTSYKRIGDESTDLVQGLGVHENSIAVYCENSIWLIYMPDPTDDMTWQTIKLASPFGSRSPHCVINYKNRQLFAAQQNGKFAGFAALSGAGVEPSATLTTVYAAGSELKSERVEPDMFTIPASGTMADIYGIIHKNKAWLSVTYSGSTNNRIYLYDFSISNLHKKNKESWVPFTGSKITANYFTVFGGNVYFGSAVANGFVYKAESGTYSDDGDAINSYFYSKEFYGHGNHVNYTKDFRFANVLIGLVGGYSMDIYYRVDSETGDGNKITQSLDPGGSLWGSMRWGIDSWGGGKDQNDVRLYLGTALGKRIQFKFTNQNTAAQRFSVHGLNFHYNLKGYR